LFDCRLWGTLQQAIKKRIYGINILGPWGWPEKIRLGFTRQSDYLPGPSVAEISR